MLPKTQACQPQQAQHNKLGVGLAESRLAARRSRPSIDAWLSRNVTHARSSRQRRPMRPMATGNLLPPEPHSQRSLVSLLWQSTRFEAATLEVTSWGLCGAASAGTVASLLAFNRLAAEMIAAATAGGYEGPTVELGLLDLRFGYSAPEVAQVLQAWGPVGRRLYLVVEAIDVAVYHFGYRAAFLVLLNRLTAQLVARWPAVAPLRWTALIPVALASLDFFEDLGQVSLTAAFEASSGNAATATWWPQLVGISSGFNIAKWSLVRGGSTLTVLMLIALAVGAATGAGPPAAEQVEDNV